MFFFSYCEEIFVEENEVNDSLFKSSIEIKLDVSLQLFKKFIINSTLIFIGSSEVFVSVWVVGFLFLYLVQWLVFFSLRNFMEFQFGERVEGRLVVLWLVYLRRYFGVDGFFVF